jgi:hypothetical protein
LALLTGGTLAAATAGAATAAETPAPPVGGATVTAIGTAAVPVRRPARLTDATIAAAVSVARDAAGPKAVVKAREEAERLAASLGLRVGALQSVAEQSNSPFFFYGGLDGTFGPGRYCGTIRRRVMHTTKSGRRVPTGKIRSRHLCRVPPNVTTSVSATYLVVS